MDSTTSEYKVTYLLGAGASAQALPTVKPTSNSKGLSDSLRAFADYLQNDNSISSSYSDYTEKLANDLYWVADNSEKFGTPDTFAKYLYLKDRDQLILLKHALSVYFTYTQLIEGKFDDRALVFITSVMEINALFPSNIKILNWNHWRPENPKNWTNSFITN